MLYLVGLGLGDERDITVRGLEVVKKCKRVYLEHYTSILGVDKDKLEEFYGREVILADREMVEQGADDMLEGDVDDDIALLVVGDPFGATTHSDFMLRAKHKGMGVGVIHNASIMNAIGCCGLQLYSYGETVSICFFTDSWRPDSFYEKIRENRKRGLHTLCLLDIKVKEQTLENIMKRNNKFEPPRYMTVNQCIEQLMEVEENKGEGAYSWDTICVGLSKVGQPTQILKAGTMRELLTEDFGEPLHSFVIAGDCHFLESDNLKEIAVNQESLANLSKQ
eukprot:CFRG5559T1